MNRRTGLLLMPLVLAACQEPLRDAARPYGDLAHRDLTSAPTLNLEERSRSAPAAPESVADVVPPALRASGDGSVEITLALVRAAALEGNLDLAVDVLSPEIARTAEREEEAAFESLLHLGARRSHTDSPTFLGTEGSLSDFTSLDAGVTLPLRTGGSLDFTFPIAKTSSNNPFSLLDPAYTAEWRFSFSQPLLRGAGTRVNTHALRVARTESLSAQARTRLEVIRVLAAADRAYWSLYAAQRRLDVARQQYDVAVQQRDKAARRVAAGDLAQIEVVRAESGLASTLESVIVADALVRRQERALKAAMNRDDLPIDGAELVLTRTDPAPLSLDLDPIALADFAVATRMEMLELELALAIDSASIDFAENGRLPLVALDYTYSVGGLGADYRSAIGQLPPHRFEDWSVGVRAEIPLGNEAADARLHRAILQRVQRLATREQRRQSIRQETFDALDTLREAWQRILAARQEVRLATRTLDGERNQFDQGLSTSTDVLDASSRLAQARSREIDALSDYEIARIDLAFATGTLLGHGRVRWGKDVSSGDGQE